MNSVSESVSGKWSKTTISPQGILEDLLSMNNMKLPSRVKYNPNLKMSGSIKLTVTQSSDGTMLFTKEALYKLISVLLVTDRIDQLNGYPMIEYGDVRHITVYGKVHLGSEEREYPGQREKLILPIKAYRKIDNIEITVVV